MVSINFRNYTRRLKQIIAFNNIKVRRKKNGEKSPLRKNQKPTIKNSYSESRYLVVWWIGFFCVVSYLFGCGVVLR